MVSIEAQLACQYFVDLVDALGRYHSDHTAIVVARPISTQKCLPASRPQLSASVSNVPEVDRELQIVDVVVVEPVQSEEPCRHMCGRLLQPGPRPGQAWDEWHKEQDRKLRHETEVAIAEMELANANCVGTCEPSRICYTKCK